MSKEVRVMNKQNKRKGLLRRKGNIKHMDYHCTASPLPGVVLKYKFQIYNLIFVNSSCSPGYIKIKKLDIFFTSYENE